VLPISFPISIAPRSSSRTITHLSCASASSFRKLLQGRGEELNTLQTEGEMIQRVVSGLMGLKNVLVLNDEAHHCYREKPVDLKGEAEDEAKKNNEAARLWISVLDR
jgi:type III restriction enzyme